MRWWISTLLCLPALLLADSKTAEALALYGATG